MHKCIFFLMSMLGILLQLKSGGGGTASLFVTNYNTLLTFIVVVLLVYMGTSFAVKLLQADSDYSELASECMNNISILTGILASILLLLILAPALGYIALALWSICFISFVIKSRQYLVSLYESGVAGLAHAFHRFKELINIRSNQRDAADQINGLTEV
ncbi:hypothetical protein ACLB2K_057381 [Fragaria x ananassa]